MSTWPSSVLHTSMSCLTHTHTYLYSVPYQNSHNDDSFVTLLQWTCVVWWHNLGQTRSLWGGWTQYPSTTSTCTLWIYSTNGGSLVDQLQAVSVLKLVYRGPLLLSFWSQLRLPTSICIMYVHALLSCTATHSLTTSVSIRRLPADGEDMLTTSQQSEENVFEWSNRPLLSFVLSSDKERM